MRVYQKLKCNKSKAKPETPSYTKKQISRLGETRKYVFKQFRKKSDMKFRKVIMK